MYQAFGNGAWSGDGFPWLREGLSRTIRLHRLFCQYYKSSSFASRFTSWEILLLTSQSLFYYSPRKLETTAIFSILQYKLFKVLFTLNILQINPQFYILNYCWVCCNDRKSFLCLPTKRSDLQRIQGLATYMNS